MWLLYQIAVSVALLVGAPVFALRRGRHYLATIRGRTGGYEGEVPERPLWIHAVSVGEVSVAATLASRLPRTTPLLITTVTPTGQRRARELLGDRAAVAYLPFDVGWPVGRFLRRFRPRALLLSEGDYWPLILREVRRLGLPVAVFNGRVSDRGFRRMLGLRRLLGATLGRIDRFAVQTAADERRLSELGVSPDRIAVTGNLKYDSAPPEVDADLEARLRELARGRPILLAGSTMAGEEQTLVDAFRAVGGGAQALLVVAPRHPERWEEVRKLLEREIPATARRSRLEEAQSVDALLLDSLGELAGLYGVATVAFVGGTLGTTGGHNPLEPARFGVPVAAGPSMENFREIADSFDEAGAWRRVANAAELAGVWRDWLERPEEARRIGTAGAELVLSSRGALDRTVEALEPILSPRESS